MSEVIERQSTTPAQLLQIAVESGADIDKLDRLMEMQLKWEANEARKQFVQAMANFHAEAPTIGKNRNGHNSKYASLDQITETVNPLLAKHGFSFGWVTDQGDTITVHCDVTHIGGHSQRVSLTAGPDTSGSKNSIQAIGSTVSYLQRYTLLSALGLSTGEMDDDARSATQAVLTDENADLLADLECAADEGTAALKKAWEELPGETRKAIGGDRLSALKERANAAA